MEPQSRTDFPLFTGQTVFVKEYTGTVLKSEKRSHSETHGGGGGGSVYIGGGQSVNRDVAPIRTDVHEVHEFWFRNPQGDESSVTVYSHDLPLREGQIVTVYAVGEKGVKLECFSFLFNYNSKEFHSFVGPDGYAGSKLFKGPGFLSNANKHWQSMVDAFEVVARRMVPEGLQQPRA